MEAEELRIGNLVNLSGEQMIFKIDYDRKRGLLPNGYEADLFQPIPLTKDWLIKFGYEWDSNSGQLISEQGPGLYSDSDFNLVYDEFYTKYVHRFQNYVFFLTGEELTIKQTA